MNHVLCGQYVRVLGNDKASYGGNQGWFENKRIAQYGCGLIGVGDIMLYLSGKSCLPQKEYLEYQMNLHHRLVPISMLIRGTVGPALALAFNLWSMGKKQGYRACWCMSVDKMHDRIAKMLDRNIPVLFSVGAAFPCFWSRKGVTLFQNGGKNGELALVTAGSVNKHYMVMTGLIHSTEYGELLRISSWGKEYYIQWEEYQNYARKKSMGLITNILYIHQ